MQPLQRLGAVSLTALLAFGASGAADEGPSRALRCALGLAVGVGNPGRRAAAIAVVAEQEAMAGDADRAVRVATTITDPDDRGFALSRVALAALAAGDPVRALALARAVPDPDWRARTLAATAEQLSRGGHPDAAAQALDDATRSLPAVATADLRGWAQAVVAAAAAASGRCDLAIELAGAIVDPLDRAIGLADAATGCALAGQTLPAREAVARAAALTDQIAEPSWRDRALVRVAAATATAGQIDVATRQAGSITSGLRAQALGEVAAAAIQHGDHDAGLRVLRTIPDGPLAGPAIARAVDVDAADTAADGIAAVAEALHDPQASAATATALARAAARRGDRLQTSALLDRALTSAATVPATLRVRLLEEIATVALDADVTGHVDRALDALEDAVRHVDQAVLVGPALEEAAVRRARHEQIGSALELVMAIRARDQRASALARVAGAWRTGATNQDVRRRLRTACTAPAEP